MKTRRTVETTDRARGKGRGRGPKLWAYGYADLARLLGTTEAAIRQRVRRKLFDPGDLASVCRAWSLSESGLDPFWSPSDSPHAKAKVATPAQYKATVPVITRT